MAETYNNDSDPKNGRSKKAAPVKPAPVKPAPSGKPAPAGRPANPRLAEAQRRAQSMARNQPANPRQFFEEAWVELKKTSWPNRDTLTKSTSVVLALVLAVAVWVGVIDAVLTQVSGPLFNAHH